MDFLKSAVASAIAKGSSFPYSLEDRVDIDDSIWTLHNATKRENGSPCSVFTFDVNMNRSRLPLAKNAMRKSRTLRHPGVLKVMDTLETDTNLYIITERVFPLSWAVKRRSVSEETAKWGLYTVASTLRFINEDASSVHGVVRVSSVFTSESGEWKLGGLDVLSSMNDDDAVIYAYGSLVPNSARYTPPEVVNGGWDVIRRHPLGAVDGYGLGVLVFEVFNGSFAGGDQVGKTTNIPPSMHQSYKRLCTANPKQRLSPAHFVGQGKKSGGFFHTPLIRLTDDIESLSLKSDAERGKFINELDDLSEDFPETFMKMKILPELLKSVEFGGGGPKVLGAIVKIGTKLTEEEYNSKLTPVVVRLFGNPDRALRVSLLDNLPLMIDYLPQKVVNDKIFPQITSGFTDVTPVVREQTVKAVLPVIGKLSDRTINGDLLKFLARTSNDDQPGIRTNTTICLGKIAKNLGQSSRTKVLVAAFTRALRDPFVHARNAGLLALTATIDIFSEGDCANRVLPAICPVLLDREQLVRDQANKTLDAYLQRVRNYGSSMPNSVLPPPSTTDTTANGAARMGTPTDKSWAGWAISSFTNKITSAEGEIRPTADGSKSVESDAARSASVPRPSKSTPSTELDVPKETLSPTPHPLSRSISDQVVPVSQQAGGQKETGDTGEEDEGYDDTDPFSFTSNTKPDVPQQKSAPVPFDDGGEPDFAGWLAAQSKAKTKKPLPKGLPKTNSSKGLPSRTSTATRGMTKPKRIIAPPKLNHPNPKDVQAKVGQPGVDQPKNDHSESDAQPKHDQSGDSQLKDNSNRPNDDDNDDDDDDDDGWGAFD